MPKGLTLEKLWTELGFAPNPAQREAIHTLDGPLYLTAGPGSGKTRVLLQRTLNLIVFHHFPPDRIFLGTFTQKAAHQLREGLRGLLAIVTDRSGVPDDQEAFIAERQRTILEAVENLLIKERLDLSPPLRELDRDIEKAELELRRSVVSALDNVPERLPSHVLQKLDETILRAAKKNAAIEIEDYETLKAKLEYADLRELQEATTSKATWDRFESRFANKETLNTKFGQLAELRNGIRHSRTVSEITRKEGEAAILWFKEVLNK